MKLPMMILAAVAGFFLLLFPQPERTEWVVDGQYKPLGTERKTMAKLLELAKAEDIDGIYAAFSQTAKEADPNLPEHLEELVRFLNTEVESWEFRSGGGGSKSHHGQRIERVMFFTVQTSAGEYNCTIADVRWDDYNGASHEENVGLTEITLYPDRLGKEYGKAEGALVVYQAGCKSEPFPGLTDPMESMVTAAEAGDAEAILGLFAQAAKDSTGSLPEQTPALADFLAQRVTAWEPYTWVQRVQHHEGGDHVARELFFHLDTPEGVWRCDLRLGTEDPCHPETVGLYSVTLYPELREGEDSYENEEYQEFCVKGREKPGIFIREEAK